MAPDEPSAARPGPVVLRIKLRYDDVEVMIARFAPNVGKTGLFLPTKSLQPVGAEIKFELRLATDQPVLVGLGRVKAAQAPDPQNPKATFGMAVELMRVTRESRDLILKMLERRRQLGIGDVGIPMPADVDAARRADFDTGVKDAASGSVPAYIPSFESQPASTPFTAPRRQTGPIAIAKVVHVEPLAPEPPRRKRVAVADLIASASGPIAAPTSDGLDDDVDVAAALARARSLAAGADLDGELEALRDSAATPIAIDIEAASAELARQLGGAAVRKSARWAPPPKIDAPSATEAALAELARGTEPAPTPEPIEATIEPALATEPTPALEPAPVEATPEPEPEARKDEEPPAIVEQPKPVEESPKEDALSKLMGRLGKGARDRVVARRRERMTRDSARFEAQRALQPEPEPPKPDPVTEPAAREPAIAAPEERDEEALFERPRSQRFLPENADQIRTRPASESPLIHDDADASQFEDAHEVQPEQIHDEIHRLDERDYEEVEHTQIGEGPAEPDPDAFAQHAYATLPSEQAASADRIDAELAQAEEEAAVDDLGFGPESVVSDPRNAYRGPDETVESGSGGFALADEAAQSGDYVIPLSQDYERSESLEAALVAAVEQEARDDDEEEIEEIDDFEILAEADADDADLLMAAAEQEVARPSGVGMPVDLELPPARPSFLNRLDLGDDSGYHTPAAADSFDEFSHEPGEVDPRVLSAGYALRGFEEPEPDDPGDFNAPGTYTPIPRDPYAVDPPSDDFDAPHGNYGTPATGFVPPDAFDQSDVISIRPETPPAQRAEEEFDLETALEALDVDLDDLGDSKGPIVRAGRNRKTPKPMQAVTTDDIPTHRGRSEGGIAHSPTEHAPKSNRTQRRASTEDGILIDFDDDDQ